MMADSWITRSAIVGVLTACPRDDREPLNDLIATVRRWWWLAGRRNRPLCLYPTRGSWLWRHSRRIGLCTLHIGTWFYWRVCLMWISRGFLCLHLLVLHCSIDHFRRWTRLAWRGLRGWALGRRWFCWYRKVLRRRRWCRTLGLACHC